VPKPDCFLYSREGFFRVDVLLAFAGYGSSAGADDETAVDPEMQLPDYDGPARADCCLRVRVRALRDERFCSGVA
jgi:hypothetical protein